MADYEGIKFRYADMQRELERMQTLTQEFISEDSRWVFGRCLENLENIRCAKQNRVHQFEINKECPLKTISSEGEYRASQKERGISVFGTLSFRMGLENPHRGKNRQSDFHLVGEATTSIQIFNSETDKLVARWQIEAGDATSPGCHFHSAANQYSEDGIFPEWLKVPRLPSVLLTPMDGLEFLLGELFQTRWREHVSVESEVRNSWAKLQGDRIKRILTWSLSQVSDPETTAWMDLKRAKPPLGLLTE
ncbi:MAG: hypothetical protein AAGD07_22450 [Planctomycetota bacterium]